MSDYTTSLRVYREYLKVCTLVPSLSFLSFVLNRIEGDMTDEDAPCPLCLNGDEDACSRNGSYCGRRNEWAHFRNWSGRLNPAARPAPAANSGARKQECGCACHDPATPAGVPETQIDKE